MSSGLPRRFVANGEEERRGEERGRIGLEGNVGVQVRRLIRGTSVASCSSTDLAPVPEHRECGQLDWRSEGGEEEVEEVEEVHRRTQGDFRHLLQLTTVDDRWTGVLHGARI